MYREVFCGFQTSTKRSTRGCPLLGVSNVHSFTVRVLRARRAPGHSPRTFRPAQLTV